MPLSYQVWYCVHIINLHLKADVLQLSQVLAMAKSVSLVCLALIIWGHIPDKE